MKKVFYLILAAVVALASACSRPVKEKESAEPFVPVDEIVEQGSTITSMDV